MDSEQNIVTAIVSKNKSNCAVYVNGVEDFVCDKDLVVKFRLSKGDELSEDLKNEIISEQRIYEAKQAAYNFVSYKPRTTFQVEQKLRKKNLSDEEIEIAIDFLKEFGHIDDEKYAETFCKDYIKRKNVGKKKMIYELGKRGIDKDLAETKVRELYPEESQRDFAMEAARKKLKKISHKPPQKRKNSLINHLKRLGFPWEITRSVVEEFIGDEEND